MKTKIKEREGSFIEQNSKVTQEICSWKKLLANKEAYSEHLVQEYSRAMNSLQYHKIKCKLLTTL